MSNQAEDSMDMDGCSDGYTETSGADLDFSSTQDRPESQAQVARLCKHVIREVISFLDKTKRSITALEQSVTGALESANPEDIFAVYRGLRKDFAVIYDDQCVGHDTEAYMEHALDLEKAEHRTETSLPTYNEWNVTHGPTHCFQTVRYARRPVLQPKAPSSNLSHWHKEGNDDPQYGDGHDNKRRCS